MAEPTFDKLLEEIDRVLERGYGYRVLVGATREATRMLRNDPDEPLVRGEWSHPSVTGMSAFGGQQIH